MVEQTRSWQRQISRRRVLKSAALGGTGLVGAAVIGCGREERPTSSTSGAAQPKRGGILVRAGGLAGSWDTRGTTLDPHVNSQVISMGHRLFLQGLLGYDLRTLEVEPELAQKWEQPSQTEYIFTLQPGVKWHNKPPLNSRELTVEDVIFSLERVRTDNPLYQHASVFETVDKIAALDKTRVRITTKLADAGLLSGVSGDGPLIVARELVEKTEGKFAPLAENAVGTGAFIVKSIEQDVAVEYVRNPDYWKPGRPYLDAVRSQHFAGPQEGYAAFLAGRVHIAQLPGEEVQRYIARQGPSYVPDWHKAMGLDMVTPNLQRKPMDDSRVTRALRLMLDHDELKNSWAAIVFGRGRHQSVLPSGLEDWDFPEEEYTKRIFWKQPKDDAVREAQALLRAAGFTRENPLKFEIVYSISPTYDLGSQIIQAQWRRHSQGIVDVTLKPYQLADLLPIQARGEFTYGPFGFAIGTNDPGTWLFTLYHSRGSRNRMRLKDPHLDTMIEKQQGVFNVQQRKALIREIVSYMMDNSPGVILSGRFNFYATQPQVRDYASENFMNGRQYEWVWLDQ